jgi:hypothetical protein
MKDMYILLLTSIFIIGCVQAVNDFNYSKLAETQKSHGNLSEWLENTGFADISKAPKDIAPKISIGNYDSTKYEIPIGPYKASFELRSPLSYFGVLFYRYNESAGSGKEYHTARYDVYSFLSGNVSNYSFLENASTTSDSNGNSTTVETYQITPMQTFGLKIYIIRYKGPSEYQAAAPWDLLDNIFKIPSTWDDGSPTEITIDGKKGTTWNDIKWSKSDRILAERYTYRYDLDQDTIVVIIASGKDWDVDKDLSLFEETLHIAEK